MTRQLKIGNSLKAAVEGRCAKLSGVLHCLSFMTKGKIVAIATGAFSILIAVVYLILVLILDSRGEMKPAPVSHLPPVVQLDSAIN